MGYFAQGQWKADCDQCGRTFKSGQLRKMWNGTYACQACWEPRQPQDFVRAVKDGTPPPWTRGQPFQVVSTTVPGSLTASQTSVVTADGSGFPTSYPYFCLLQQDQSEELVKVTNKSSNTFTVLRGFNSVPLAFDAGATFLLA